jgi:hypothetical protein
MHRRALLLAPQIEALGDEELNFYLRRGELLVHKGVIVPAISGGAEHPTGVTDQASGTGVTDVRVRERTVGGSVQAEQVVVQTALDVETGVYRAHTGLITYTAAADGATAGKWWLLNRSAAQQVRLIKVEFYTFYTATTVFLATPRFTLETMTHTGTPSAGLVTPAKRVRTTQNGITLDATNVGEIRTAVTGFTPVAGVAFDSFYGQTVPILIASGAPPPWPVPQYHDPPADDAYRLAAANGEGFVCRQADAGVASDTRKFYCNVVWKEVTQP